MLALIVINETSRIVRNEAPSAGAPERPRPAPYVLAPTTVTKKTPTQGSTPLFLFTHDNIFTQNELSQLHKDRAAKDPDE